MLNPVLERGSSAGTSVPIREARYPAPFLPGLEFNPPAHGGWNIVHVGMLVPEAHQIYVCGTNCMRGVILTAVEMNASDRFSFVILEEEDLVEGTVEEITIQGVADVLGKLPKLPPMVMLFTVCLHRFLGCDQSRIYRELEARFPGVAFARCAMEPISQKEGLSPDQRLRKSMFDALRPRPAVPRTAVVLGSDFALDEDGLPELLNSGGWQLRQLQQCRDYEAYRKLAEAELFLSTFPRARYGAEQTAKRLGRRHLYLPASFSYEELTGQRRKLCEAMGIPAPDCAPEIAACERALSETLALVGETPICIDYTAHPRPLGLARLLLSHGFRVETVYLDSVSPEEQGDFQWLQEHFGGLTLAATNQAACRTLPRGRRAGALAVGQIAAWFCQTPHFVNLVEGGGLWGFEGVMGMLARIREAYRTEQDTRDLIPRKGLGCMSCV